MPSNPIVTFTSDFGAREQYVGAVKGVILSSCPNAVIVDISHEIGAHDLIEAAFVLANAYAFYPPRTIHLVVVDPTVGSSRRPIVAVCDAGVFVAPDNGVLSLVYAKEPVRVLAIEAEHYFRKPVSPTFHGRDVFAPVAGALGRGIDPDTFGPVITDYVRFALPPLRKAGEKTLEGVVLHIDKFGNVITNITPGDLSRNAGAGAKPGVFKVGGKVISAHRRYFSESNADELFSVVGSSGYFEISAFRKSAARLLEAKRGAKVELEIA
jgi:S-adenosylmethionine hydrolase